MRYWPQRRAGWDGEAMTAVAIDNCPAKREYPAAFVCCNLFAGHGGLHDDGLGGQWNDETTTPGPDRLQMAAICLLGSSEGIADLRRELYTVLGKDDGEDAVLAIGRVLRRWKEGKK